MHDQSLGVKLSKVSVERAAAVFAGLDLGDPRRTQRVTRIVANLASNPEASFPKAMGSEAEIEGAYRLMNSNRVTMEALNDAHAEITARRAVEAKIVVAIHDSTTCEFAHGDPETIGYTNTGKAGFLVHYTLVVSAGERRPLGVVHVEEVVRRKPPRKRSSLKAKKKKRHSGFETVRDPNRESLRWNRGFAAAHERLQGTEVIHLADREGDNYNLLAQALSDGCRFVIRARTLERRVESTDGESQTLYELVLGAQGVLTREVDLPPRKAAGAPKIAHPPRSARLARLAFSAARVILPRPKIQPVNLPKQLEVNVVRVWESSPPPGEAPIEWVLYTTEPIEKPSDVAAVVDLYRARWLIEECNKAIKTGCRYEKRQFDSLHALLTLLALTLPVACEVLALRAACRRTPTAPATAVLTPTQLQILAVLGSRKLPRNPTVRDALWAVAALGGHMKTNGEPGWLVLHRGMAELLAYEKGWRAREKMTGLSISR
jgi:Transposase DNA-binding/Transposase DDE domain